MTSRQKFNTRLAVTVSLEPSNSLVAGEEDAGWSVGFFHSAEKKLDNLIDKAFWQYQGGI